ncbi:hypothetical protein EYA84_02135 [Verrucosispora sp. SN26_14.1]|uniref:hypothetical protein n=1 Tax=Verrucosispora sp. SN26_14.1 TaxID=2527879 RepID=UPI001033863B|nr:hypothetical protein [Verrucosispora sp. SN26_14.1]TBL44263.1 hypothetical protein EYA84_02135 [Verrucosispora sp. SN26_14.1]
MMDPEIDSDRIAESLSRVAVKATGASDQMRAAWANVQPAVDAAASALDGFGSQLKLAHEEYQEKLAEFAIARGYRRIL